MLPVSRYSTPLLVKAVRSEVKRLSQSFGSCIGLDDVPVIRDDSPQARHSFTVADQVNQLVSASEADSGWPCGQNQPDQNPGTRKGSITGMGWPSVAPRSSVPIPAPTVALRRLVKPSSSLPLHLSPIDSSSHFLSLESFVKRPS